MIKLKNIVNENGVLSCQLFPEDNQKAGNIKVDVCNNQVISFNLPIGYEWCKNHIQHAKDSLLKLYISGESIPKKKTLMWY